MKYGLLVFALCSSTAFATRTVTVSGKCEIKVVPDRGSVQLTMEHTAKTVEQAVEHVTETVDKARASIKKLNLKDLELRTTHFSVNEQREWENNKQVFKGFRASQGLEVTTSEVAKLGEVMGHAAKLGINGTSNLRTFLSLEKSQAEYLKCLDVAAKDARAKAERLADTLKANVGEVESIIESAPQIHSPQPMYAMEAMMTRGGMADAKMASPSLDVADQLYSTSIQVKFNIK